MSYNSIPECKPPVSPMIITVPQFIHSSLEKFQFNLCKIHFHLVSFQCLVKVTAHMMAYN